MSLLGPFFQTLKGIGRAFEPERILGVREEPRLREQDFGNFQVREPVKGKGASTLECRQKVRGLPCKEASRTEWNICLIEQTEEKEMSTGSSRRKGKPCRKGASTRQGISCIREPAEEKGTSTKGAMRRIRESKDGFRVFK